VKRRRIVPRGEGLSSDKSTDLRSLRQTCGRFSVRGPAAWRVDGGTGKKITTSILECKGLRNRLCAIVADHNTRLGKAADLVGTLPGYGAIQDVTKAGFLPPKVEYSPYDAHKQKENGKAQLGGPAT
jgi:hypothetical protein